MKWRWEQIGIHICLSLPPTLTIQGTHRSWSHLPNSCTWLSIQQKVKSRTKKQENTAHIQGGGKQNSQKKLSLGFAGGSVVKNPSANPGDMGLIPDLGGSHGAHATEQLSPCATALEPGIRNYWTQVSQLLTSKCPGARGSATWEACTATREQPPLASVEKSPCSNEDPARSKINNKNIIKKRKKLSLSIIGCQIQRTKTSKYIQRTYGNPILKIEGKYDWWLSGWRISIKWKKI